MKLARGRVVAAMAFVFLAAGLVPAGRNGLVLPAQAQNLGQRTVMGTVVDAESAPMAGATVFLRNSKTKSIRSYTSGKNGRFHFAQVNMADDFDLWAEKDGKKSAVKTVSSWDARKQFETELKIK